MARRSRHGNAGNFGFGSVTEIRPLDEQGPGVQAPPQADTRDERTAGGQLVKGASKVPSMGGKARKNRHAIEQQPALKAALARPEFRPFLRRGAAFRAGVVRHLAQNVGGGEADPITCAIVALAADQLAGARYFTALAAQTLDPADFMTAKSLGDSCRQNLVAARDACELHAKSKPKQRNPVLARIEARAAQHLGDQRREVGK